MTLYELATLIGWFTIVGSLPLLLQTLFSLYQAYRRGQKPLWRALLFVCCFPGCGIFLVLVGMRVEFIWPLLLAIVLNKSFDLGKPAWFDLMRGVGLLEKEPDEPCLVFQRVSERAKRRRLLVGLICIFAVYSVWIMIAYWHGGARISMSQEAIWGVMIIAIAYGIAIEMERLRLEGGSIGWSFLFFSVLYGLPIGMIRGDEGTRAICVGVYGLLLVRFVLFAWRMWFRSKEEDGGVGSGSSKWRLTLPGG